MYGYGATTLRIETTRLIGECVYANYHMGGHGFDYRFRIRDNKGLYITKWAEGTQRSAGYPDNWEVYELTFRDENDDRGIIGKSLGFDLDEAAVVQLAMNIRNS